MFVCQFAPRRHFRNLHSSLRVVQALVLPWGKRHCDLDRNVGLKLSKCSAKKPRGKRHGWFDEPIFGPGRAMPNLQGCVPHRHTTILPVHTPGRTRVRHGSTRHNREYFRVPNASGDTWVCRRVRLIMALPGPGLPKHSSPIQMYLAVVTGYTDCMPHRHTTILLVHTPGHTRVCHGSTRCAWAQPGAARVLGLGPGASGHTWAGRCVRLIMASSGTPRP